MNIKNQERFIKRFLAEYISVKYRLARNRLLFGIVAGVISLNIFNFIIMNPLNVNNSTEDATPSVK